MLQRLTSIYIALLLTIFLLAFPWNGYMGISEFKYVLFLLICGGYVAAVIILRVFYAQTDTEPTGTSGRLPLAAKCLLGFLGATILSALFSASPGVWIGPFRQEGILTIAIYVLSCLFLSLYFRPQKWMLFLLGTGTALNSILALVQLTGQNPLWLFPEGHNYYGAGVYYSGEFLGTIGNAGLLGGFLSLAVGLLAMALIKFEFKMRWLLALPLFLAVLLIFEMGIDAAFVALATGLTLMLPIAVTSRKTLADTLLVFAVILAAFTSSEVLIFQDGPLLFTPIRLSLVLTFGLVSLLAVWVQESSRFAKLSTKHYQLGAAAVTLGVIAAALTYLWHYSGDSGLLYEASQILRGNWDDTFGTRRVYIWRNVLERIHWSTLLLGTGPDTLGFWDIPPFSRYDEHLGITITMRIDAAHNEFLHILATGGLLSLLAYLGALVCAAVSWIRQPDNAGSAVAGAGVLFYGIQSLFGISQFITAPFLWTCLGILLWTQTPQRHTE